MTRCQEVQVLKMFQDSASSSSSSDSSPTSPMDSGNLSASLNVIFRASAALANRYKNSKRHPPISIEKNRTDNSEVKKLLLQKTALSTRRLVPTANFKKSISKQHRSKKRFLMELHERLGVSSRVPSFENLRNDVTGAEIEQNAALSVSLGRLTEFVNGIGPSTKQRPFVENLHQVLLSDSISQPAEPGFSENFHFDSPWSPMDAMEPYSPSEMSETVPYLHWSIETPRTISFDSGSDYGSTGTRITSPSEFSDISSAADDEVFDTFGDIPAQPADFGLTDEEMQKLRASLSDYSDNNSNYDFFDVFSTCL